jgi:hypothetical protein
MQGMPGESSPPSSFRQGTPANAWERRLVPFRVNPAIYNQFAVNQHKKSGVFSFKKELRPSELTSIFK